MAKRRKHPSPSAAEPEDSSPKVEPLKCSRCGAPIAFADDPTTTCPFCQTVNDVPATYREMRASRALDAESRALAERLLKKLDKPPWLATKVLARMFDLHFMAFLMAYAVPLTLYDVAATMRFTSWIAPRLGYRTGDDVPSWIFMLFGFSLMFVVIFIPRVLGIYANRRATARMRLLSTLVARPPTTAGGPLLCRTCGAPLFVKPGDLLAVCAYCSTENALHLRTALVAAVTQTARTLAKSVTQAAEIDRAEKLHTRLQLLRELFRYMWPTVIFAGAFMLVDEPIVGPIAISVAGLLLIALPIISGMRANAPAAKQEAQQRRAGNDVPGWVALVGPAVVWAFFIWGPTFL